MTSKISKESLAGVKLKICPSWAADNSMRSVAYINIYIFIYTHNLFLFMYFLNYMNLSVFLLSVQYCLYEMINDLQSMSSFVHQLKNNFFTNCTTKETSAVKNTSFQSVFFLILFTKNAKREHLIYTTVHALYLSYSP